MYEVQKYGTMEIELSFKNKSYKCKGLGSGKLFYAGPKYKK